MAEDTLNVGNELSAVITALQSAIAAFSAMVDRSVSVMSSVFGKAAESKDALPEKDDAPKPVVVLPPLPPITISPTSPATASEPGKPTSAPSAPPVAPTLVVGPGVPGQTPASPPQAAPQTEQSAGGIFGRIGEALARAVSSVSESVARMFSTRATTTDTTQTSATQANTAAVSNLTSAVSTKSSSSTQGQGAAGAGGAMAAVGGVISSVVGAASAGFSVVTDLIGKLSGFVEALSPSTIQQFQRVVADLNATIGVAFKPVFDILIGTVQQISGIILPIMEGLRPIVAQITDVFVSLLIPQVKLVATIFEGLMPVLQVLVTVFALVENVLRPVVIALQGVFAMLGAGLEVLITLLQPVFAVLELVSGVMAAFGDALQILMDVFGAVIKTVVEAFKALFQGLNLKSVLDMFVKGIVEATKSIIIFVATIAKFFGFDIGKIIGALEPKSGAKAAGQTSIKTFDQISKDINVASSRAAGAGTEQKPKFDLGDVVKQLQDIDKNGATWGSDILELLRSIFGFLTIPKAIATYVAGSVMGSAGGAITTDDVYRTPEGRNNRGLR